MELKQIVIGVDFSPASADAARWAVQHFGRDVELIFAHAIHERDNVAGEPLLEGATKRMRDFGSAISAERVRFDVREGDAARSLSDVATEYGADLLIVGARGERADLERALGTTAQYAIRQSAIPVLVVARPHERPISHILVTVEDDETARASLQWAALLSQRFKSRVTALHISTSGVMSHAAAGAALPPNPQRVNARAGSDEADRWIALARAAGVAPDRVTSEETRGVPAVEIVSASERNASDIIVMGRRAARNLQRAVLGSVTATVLSNPPCSVLVVPAT